MRIASTVMLFIITVLLAIYIVPQTEFYQELTQERRVQKLPEGKPAEAASESLEARADAAGYCGSAGCTDPDTGRRIINDRLLTPAENAIYARCETEMYDDIVNKQDRSLAEYRAAAYNCARKSIGWL